MPRTYLTEEEVREIREKVSQGLSTYKVAEAYKVSQSYVSKLARGLNRAAEMQRAISAQVEKIDEAFRPMRETVKKIEEFNERIVRSLPKISLPNISTDKEDK